MGIWALGLLGVWDLIFEFGIVRHGILGLGFGGLWIWRFGDVEICGVWDFGLWIGNLEDDEGFSIWDLAVGNFGIEES